MKAYIEVRKDKTKKGYPIIIKVRYNDRAIAIGTGYYIDKLSYFNPTDSNNYLTKEVPDHKIKNLRLVEILNKVERYTIDYIPSHNKDIDLENKIKELVTGQEQEKEIKYFVNYLDDYVSLKTAKGTIAVYQDTKSQILKYDPYCTFKTMDRRWLTAFESWMLSRMKINSAGIHLRNIRAIFNYAIDEEITTLYPFRKFHIKKEETIKRSLSIDQLRLLKDYPVLGYQKKYRDLFMLIFYLIGINAADLFNITDINPDGRIEYYRAKTHKLYSIKVEPEALEIINRYKGNKYLLYVMDTYKNYKDFLHRMNENLQEIGEITYEEKMISGKRRKIKKAHPAFPGLSSYWARHTWATLAAELDIPKETISAALGHNIGSSVTSIYIDFDRKKIDDANRKVIDYLLGNG